MDSFCNVAFLEIKCYLFVSMHILDMSETVQCICILFNRHGPHTHRSRNICAHLCPNLSTNVSARNIFKIDRIFCTQQTVVEMSKIKNVHVGLIICETALILICNIWAIFNWKWFSYSLFYYGTLFLVF